MYQSFLEQIQGTSVPTQTQTIRKQMNNVQVHLYVDDWGASGPCMWGESPLKAAVPVAEWFYIMRNLRSMNPFTFIDAENNCVVYLRPYIHEGVFEVTIELAPIEIGPNFKEINALTGK